MKFFIALALLWPFCPTIAQDFPLKAVRLIVPFPPGGPVDLAGRLIGKELADRWGQPVIIDNRAGGYLGPEALSKAVPDGYTLMIISSTPLVSLPHMQKVPYDVLKAFVGISQTAALTYAMIAHPSTGITTVQQLIDTARKSPGKLNYGSGNGSGQHLYTELFKLAAGGLDITHIPYKGAGPSMQGFLSGETQMTMDVLSSVIGVVNAGKARALLVSGARPVDSLRGVPTFESMFPGLGISNWHGIFAPAGMARPLQDRLALDIRQALAAPLLSKRFSELGFDPASASTEEFSQIILRDYEGWGALIRKNNIKAE